MHVVPLNISSRLSMIFEADALELTSEMHIPCKLLTHVVALIISDELQGNRRIFRQHT